LKLMLLLLALKLIGVTISYASGNAGGIFGPSLFIGAMLGGSLGTVAHNLFPAFVAAPGAYALVGMGAVAGIVRAFDDFRGDDL
jgi:chloride channel protein, CIC family